MIMHEYALVARRYIRLLQTTNDFQSRATKRGIKIITSESFTGDPRQQVRNLKVRISTLFRVEVKNYSRMSSN